MEMKEEKWIKKGYETFAIWGENGLKVEQLAKEVGTSKSSFYHYFSDLTVFVERLLFHHLKNSKIIAEKERLAQSVNPELIDILVEHKMDLLFNRQLRFHSDRSEYKETLVKSNTIIGNEFIRLWLSDSKIEITQRQAEGIFELALENFFLQINSENLTKPWLEAYFENLNRITRNFIHPLYGTD